jgi:hypothetical protein
MAEYRQRGSRQRLNARVRRHYRLMIPSSHPDPHGEALRTVRQWFTLIAASNWPAAMALIDEPNSYGLSWTQHKIRTTIEHDTFGPGTVHAAEHPEGVIYSSPEHVPGEPRVAIVDLRDGSGFTLEHPVPLNSEWSDITAQFEFLVRPTGWAVILHDLHVL